jgi:membrane-bound ClpP family serine protease
LLNYISDWFQIEIWLVVLILVVKVAVIAFVVERVVRVHRRKIAAGREDLVGKTAIVKTALQPRGTVFVQGENWTALVEEGRVEPGEEVVVTGVNNLVLSVVKSK